MKYLIMFILFLGSLNVLSQDLITLRNGQEISCKITKLDSATIYYDFVKANRTLSSFVSKSSIREYKLSTKLSNPNDSVSGNTMQVTEKVLVDTTKYIPEINKWLNLITYAQIYGITSTGWSIQYFGYNMSSTSRWSIPIVFGFENFIIKPKYVTRNISMSYLKAGISPFYRITNSVFLNLGFNFLYGNESYSSYTGNMFWGIAPSQGIYFIPRSKVGLMVGLGFYEKYLFASNYQGDVGLKLEVGIKF